MKFVISLVFIFIVAFATYSLTKKNKKRAIVLTGAITVLLLGSLALIMYKDTTAVDIQCGSTHQTSSVPPTSLKTAADYFLQGNYDYDIGNCTKAIEDYSKSIKLNPGSPQTYNNRAYTFMRLRDYKSALTDLDHALAIKPDYIQALMNRGDIHNYYYAIDRKSSVTDYEKVIALGGTKGTSVCGHLFLAEHNGWNLGTVLAFPRMAISCFLVIPSR
jgi:tetratricopeptide (TPR) repeat protein